LQLRYSFQMSELKSTDGDPSVIVAFETNSRGEKRFLGAVQPKDPRAKDPEGSAIIPLGEVRTAEAFGWMAQLEGKPAKRHSQLSELTNNRVFDPTGIGITVDMATPPTPMFNKFQPQLTFEVMPKPDAIALEYINRKDGQVTPPKGP
jgi:hypothetical protein